MSRCTISILYSSIAQVSKSKSEKKRKKLVMRKFEIPSRQSKKAFPRATHLGSEVSVVGVSHIDESQRVYYTVRPVGTRKTSKAVRCDKLLAL